MPLEAMLRTCPLLRLTAMSMSLALQKEVSLSIVHIFTKGLADIPVLASFQMSKGCREMALPLAWATWRQLVKSRTGLTSPRPCGSLGSGEVSPIPSLAGELILMVKA